MSIVSTPLRDYAVRDGESLCGPSLPFADIKLLAGADQTEGRYALTKFTCTLDVPRHIHKLEDESIYVLEGEVLVQIGGSNYELAPGGFVFMPRGVPHSVKVVSKQFIGLGVSSPGGTFDGIVLDLASLREQGTEITPEILEAVRNQHGFYVDRASS